LLDRYLRHRRAWEISLWLLLGLFSGGVNGLVSLMDIERRSLPFDWWEPFTWEYSSIVMLLALLPAQLLFERRFPFRLGTWHRTLPWHLLATVVYSLVHVLGMVGLRHLVYAAAGEQYNFGNWPRELAYEYLKDARTYAALLGIVYFYRLLLLRLQGEARLLTAPDAGPPVDAVERPERFLVRKVGAEFLVAARDIEWLEAAENYVNLHVRGRVYPLRSTMTAIQERLDPQRFVRVHRSYIVNLDFLVQIEPLDTGDARLLLKDGTHIPCSRRYRQALRGERLAATAAPM
jgi:DNA-binding LytR/AlgR family response regulator